MAAASSSSHGLMWLQERGELSIWSTSAPTLLDSCIRPRVSMLRGRSLLRKRFSRPSALPLARHQASGCGKKFHLMCIGSGACGRPVCLPRRSQRTRRCSSVMSAPSAMSNRTCAAFACARGTGLAARSCSRWRRPSEKCRSYIIALHCVYRVHRNIICMYCMYMIHVIYA